MVTECFIVSDSAIAAKEASSTAVSKETATTLKRPVRGRKRRADEEEAFQPSIEPDQDDKDNNKDDGAGIAPKPKRARRATRKD